MIDGLTSATEVVVLTRTYVEYLKDDVTDANGANDSTDENSVDDVNDHSTMRMIIQ